MKIFIFSFIGTNRKLFFSNSGNNFEKTWLKVSTWSEEVDFRCTHYIKKWWLHVIEDNYSTNCVRSLKTSSQNNRLHSADM